MAGSRARLRRRLAAGFSLFEVLAAVAILGLLYTALARAAIGGLQYEGAAERRLRASLLADQVLAELEAPLLVGSAPPVGSDEREEEQFRVELEVTPLDLATPIAALREEPAAKPRGRNQPPSLIGVPASGTPPLLELYVRVSWDEGVREVSVERSSYGFDKTAAAPTLEGLAGEQDAQQAEAEGRSNERGRGDDLPRGRSGRSDSRRSIRR